MRRLIFATQPDTDTLIAHKGDAYQQLCIGIPASCVAHGVTSDMLPYLCDGSQHPPTPSTVTMAQARLALARAGLYTPINSYMAALPDEDSRKILWQFAQNVERGSPILEKVCADMGMTSDQVDQLFILAATLEET